MISPGLIELFKNAKSYAKELGHSSVTATHLIVFIIDDLRHFKQLDNVHYKLTELKSAIIKDLKETTYTHLSIKSSKQSFAPELQKIVAHSIETFYKHPDCDINTWHMLHSIIAMDDTLSQALAPFGINHHFIKELLGSDVLSTDITQDIVKQLSLLADTKSQILAQYAVEFTSQQNMHTIDDLIGRDAELTSIVEVLLRRKKNNPMLIGKAGVGKTAIVEGLAKQIALKECVSDLWDHKIFSLDIASIIAGTRYRGDFETRIKQILDVASNDSTIILFIDEIHTVVGAGAASGSLDIANILKPYLARGVMKCIGATTDTEYSAHFEHDKALSRRFTQIEVHEPTYEQTIQILDKVKAKYEAHHGVSFTDEAIQHIVKLTNQNRPTRAQPDSAIDVLDILGARTRLSKRSKQIITVSDVDKYFAT